MKYLPKSQTSEAFLSTSTFFNSDKNHSEKTPFALFKNDREKYERSDSNNSYLKSLQKRNFNEELNNVKGTSLNSMLTNDEYNCDISIIDTIKKVHFE